MINKTLILITLFIANMTHAAEWEEPMIYGKVGLGFPEVLNGGLGVRNFNGHSGFDVSLSGGTMLIISDINLKGHYLYRFTPYQPSSFYVGAGAGVSCWTFNMPGFMVGGALVEPMAELCIGRSWTFDSGRRSFLQLGAGVLLIHPLPYARLEWGCEF